MYRTKTVILQGYAVTLLIAPAHLALAGPRVIARTQLVADHSTGAWFSSFEVPTISESGIVGFQGWLEGPGTTGFANRGIWSGGLSGVTAVIRGGEASPASLQVGTWAGGQVPTVLDNGDVAFLGGIEAEPNDVGGLFSRRRSGVNPWSVYIDDGPHAPADPPGDRIRVITSDPFACAVAGDGTAALRVGVTYGDSSAAAIFVGKPDGMVRAALTGVALPGGATSFLPDALAGPRASRSGRAVFTAYSDAKVTIGGTQYPDEGFWSFNGTESVPIMRTGSQALAMPTGTKFRGVESDRIGINDSGRVVFAGDFRDRPSGGPSAGSAVWTGLPGGGWRVVATSHQQAPSTPAGVTLGVFHTTILSSGDDVVFTSTLTGTNSAYFGRPGIWASAGPGDLRKVALVGDAAPGVGDNMIFQTLGSPSVNDSGTIVFNAGFGPFGTTTTIFGAIFVSDTLGLRALMIPGDEVRFGQGDIRIVSAASIGLSSGGDDGLQPCLNDRGQVAARVNFTDGTTGIIRLDVPCPGTVFAIGVPLCIRRRRKASM